MSEFAHTYTLEQLKFSTFEKNLPAYLEKPRGHLKAMKQLYDHDCQLFGPICQSHLSRNRIRFSFMKKKQSANYFNTDDLSDQVILDCPNVSDRYVGNLRSIREDANQQAKQLETNAMTSPGKTDNNNNSSFFNTNNESFFRVDNLYQSHSTPNIPEQNNGPNPSHFASYGGGSYYQQSTHYQSQQVNQLHQYDKNSIEYKKNLICRHWARGNCKLDQNCTFMHGTDENNLSSKGGVCFAYRVKGYCENGDNCRYAHVAGALLESVCSSWNYKQHPCRHYASGNCQLGEACNFVHIDPEEKVLEDKSMTII